MKKKKIRNHNKIWKAIDQWLESSKELDIEYLKHHQRTHVKALFYPWSDASSFKAELPEPRGKTRLKIIEGLIAIYEAWQEQLKELGKQYYLKIWLFEPYLTQSQVVCAIEDCLDFYDTTFFNPELDKKLNPNTYGALSSKMTSFEWEYRLHEEHLDNAMVGQPVDYLTQEEYEQEKKWFDNKLKKPHRVTKYKEPYGDATEGYSFEKGVVWLGENKKK